MNRDLNDARMARKDEFYTQYEDIQKEINKRAGGPSSFLSRIIG